MSERLLRVPEVAARWGCAEASVRKWIYLKHLKVVHVGRAVRIRESDVDAVVRTGFQLGPK